jgi:AcrR family transcriptional regulator
MIPDMRRGEQARNAILDAAEQQIADRGVQVPLRDIALAAGQRNNSAVNYYFRNRQELIDAIVRRRLTPMELDRARMLADLEPDATRDVHALLRVLVLPFTTVDSDYYARFLQAAALHLPTDSAQGSAWREVLDRLTRAIPIADRQARHRRVAAIGTTMFALLADRERASHTDGAVVGDADEIVTMLAAMLTVPLPAAAALPQSPVAG